MGKNRHAARAEAQEIGPTIERTMKPDYEWIDGKRVKINSVLALERSGDIGGDAVTAAKWWLCDYVFSHYGHLDILKDVLPEGYEPGNIHTFAISRGNAGERINRVRDKLGMVAHNRLVMLLVEELSFSEMGAILYPTKGREGRRAASAQCAFVLEQVCEAYIAVRREIREEIDRNKALRMGPA